MYVQYYNIYALMPKVLITDRLLQLDAVIFSSGVQCILDFSKSEEIQTTDLALGNQYQLHIHRRNAQHLCSTFLETQGVAIFYLCELETFTSSRHRTAGLGLCLSAADLL
jgi:hypothetical protein